MGVETKQEIRPDEESPETVSQQPMPQVSPIQLQVTPEIEDYLVQIIDEDFNSAKQAREQKEYGLTSKGEKINFEKWVDMIKDLYNSKREAKTVPWKFCSNRSLRIATSILDMLHARLLPTVVNEDLTQWKPGEHKDSMKVEKISMLMQWWIWVRSRLRNTLDNYVKTVIGWGDALIENYWDIQYIDKGETIETPIAGEDGNTLMNPDGTPSIMKSRRIDPFEKGAIKVYLKENVYLQEGCQDIQRDPVILEDTIPYRELEQGEAEGKFVNVTNILKDRLAQNVEIAGPELDPKARQKLIDIRLRNIPVKVQKWFGNYDADGDGFAEDVRIYVCIDHRVYLGGIPCSNLTKSGKRPLTFTKFEDRFDRPSECDGIGILEKVRELAEEIDAIFNQLTDANTLGIMKPGFYDPSGDLEAPALTLAPNKMTPVTDPNRNVMFADTSVSVEPLLKAIQLVMEFVERLTAASSYVMGKESEIVGGSGTATRTNAIVQSAEVRFALPSQRLREGAAEIMAKQLDMLQLNIPPGLETRILGEKDQPVFDAGELTQDGISGEFDCYILPDPTLGSKNLERELASMFYSLLLQNVIVGSDPTKIYKVTADLIKAYGKEPEDYLGPAPSTDDIDSPEDENTLMIQGDFKRVRAQITENHMYHIKVHQDLLQSPSLLFLQERSPNLLQEIMMAAQSHIQEHMMMMQAMMSLVTQFGGRKGNGAVGQDSGGGEGVTSNTNEGTPVASGMEQTNGPLADAMQTKREGKSQPPS